MLSLPGAGSTTRPGNSDAEDRLVSATRKFDQRLKATPTDPGVYLMRSDSGSILYVGKAASLRHRVSSYFASPSGLLPKIRRMVSKVADFEFIVTESEQEALVPGHPEESKLYLAVSWRDDELQMPPKENDRLTPEQVESIRRWIEAGAPWPHEDVQRRIREDHWQQPENKDGVLWATSGGLSDDWTYRRYDPADLWAYRPRARYDAPGGRLEGDAE